MTELNKLFVRIGASTTVTKETLISTSQSNPKKIYFWEDKNQIINNGVVYGVDPSTAQSLEDLIALVGQDGKLSTENVPGAKTVIERLTSLEAIHVKSGSEAYLNIAHTTTDSSVLTNPEIGVNIVTIETIPDTSNVPVGLLDAVNTKRYIDREVAKATTDVSQGPGVSVAVSTDATDQHKTYTVSSNLTLDYNAGSQGQGATITLKSAPRSGETQVTYGTINVSDIIGNGVLKSSSYDQTTGLLTLTFNTAEGGDNVVTVDLGNLLDIDDILVGSNSTDYLAVSLTPSNSSTDTDGSQATIDVKLVDPSIASAQSTGLTDAWQVKQYVDAKSSDLSISATGDDYINAVIDTNDNKHVILSGKTATVTGTAGAPSSETVGEDGSKTGTAATDATLTVNDTNGKMLDAATTINAVKTYIDGKLAIERKETQLDVSSLKNSLDSEDSSKGANVTVDVSIVDGKISKVGVTEDYATITRTAHADGTPATLADYVVTNGDENKLVKASNLADLKLYTDDKIAENSASLAVSAEGDDYVDASVDANNNKKINVAIKKATITGTAGTPSNETVGEDGTITGTGASAGDLTVNTTNGKSLDATETATAVKTYVDGKVAIEVKDRELAIESAIKSLDSEKSSTGSTNVLVDVSITDGKLTKLNVTEHYAEITGTRRNTGTNTDANFVITSGDEGKMVKASDLSTLKNYVDDEIAANTDDLQVNGESLKPAYISLDQSTNNNKTLVVNVSINDLTFTQGSGATDSTLTGTANSFADGSDIATKVSSFTNARIAEEIAKLDVSVSKKDTKEYIEVNTVQTNGLLSDQNVTTTYGTYGASATADSSGVATVEDTRAFVDTYDFWETFTA